MTNTESPYEIIFKELGMAGRMLAGTKTARPGQEVVWNGNVIVEGHGKLWFGDIDLATDAAALQRVADRLGKVYVLREKDARFEHESDPRLDRAVRVFEPSAQSQDTRA